MSVDSVLVNGRAEAENVLVVCFDTVAAKRLAAEAICLLIDRGKSVIITLMDAGEIFPVDLVMVTVGREVDPVETLPALRDAADEKGSIEEDLTADTAADFVDEKV